MTQRDKLEAGACTVCSQALPPWGVGSVVQVVGGYAHTACHGALARVHGAGAAQLHPAGICDPRDRIRAQVRP